MGCRVSGVGCKVSGVREQPLLSEFCFYNVTSAFPGPKRNARVIVLAPPYAGSSPANKNLRAGETSSRDVSKGTVCLSYFVLRTSYLRNTRFLAIRFGMTDIYLGKRGIQDFSLRSKLKCRTVIVSAHPSLRFGMTSFLRRSCYKVPSTFPVPEPNDVVIVPAPSYAGSSPKQKAQGKRQHQHGTYRRLTKQLCHPFGALRASSFLPGYNCVTPTGLGEGTDNSIA